MTFKKFPDREVRRKLTEEDLLLLDDLCLCRQMYKERRKQYFNSKRLYARWLAIRRKEYTYKSYSILWAVFRKEQVPRSHRTVDGRYRTTDGKSRIPVYETDAQFLKQFGSADEIVGRRVYRNFRDCEKRMNFSKERFNELSEKIYASGISVGKMAEHCGIRKVTMMQFLSIHTKWY